MAPEGKTHLVVEYFCFKEDATWTATDAALTERTVRGLAELGIIEPEEVCDSVVMRIPNAYPLFEVDYIEKQKYIVEYLERFSNLELVGRGGQFEYYNTDHAMESGIAAAKAINARADAPVSMQNRLLAP